MDIQLIFRFDASPTLGYGHAMRCLALAQSLVKLNIQCLVVACQLSESLRRSFLTLGIDSKIIDADIGSSVDNGLLIKSIDKFNAKVVLLDGYQFQEKYRQVLHQKNVKVAIFDDLNLSEHLHCDLLINAMPTAGQLGYEKSATHAKSLLGLNYSLLRDEFLAANRVHFSEKKHLLVNFGASDIGSLTIEVIRRLFDSSLAFFAEQIIVLTGAGCENISPITDLCAVAGFTHLQDCNDMANLLNHTRLAISAPGAIVYELAYCQVPTVFLTVADNQSLSAKAQQNAGWCFSYDAREEEQVGVAVDKAVDKALQLWNNESTLIEMSKCAGLLVDGQGGMRIAHSLKQCCHND